MKPILFMAVAAVLATVPAQAQYEISTVYPSPAPGCYFVVGSALPSGSLLLWNGDSIYQQQNAGWEAFYRIASGYDGSGGPAFVSLAPDGQSVLLGAGYSGSIYQFDLDGSSSATELVNIPGNYSAVYISQTQAVIDHSVYVGPGPYDYEANLVLLDLSGAPTYKTVVSQKGSASAGVALDLSGDYVFATDGITGEMKKFAVVDLVNAFDTDTPLDWALSGTAVGTFNGGGAAGTRPDGSLVVGGFGSVQIVDPDTGTVVQTLDPSGAGGYYTVLYNPVTDEIIATENTDVYQPAAWVDPETVPAANVLALILTLLVASLAGVHVLKRN